MPFAISPRSRAERFYDRTQLKDLQDPKPECLDRMRVNRESRLLQFGERLGQDSTFFLRLYLQEALFEKQV